jgi:hypothetical protein
MDLLLSQECSLCHQQIHPELQLPLNAILIEGFGMCPNCYQRVTRRMEDSYEYRAKCATGARHHEEKGLGVGIQARQWVLSKVDRTDNPLLVTPHKSDKEYLEVRK